MTDHIFNITNELYPIQNGIINLTKNVSVGNTLNIYKIDNNGNYIKSGKLKLKKQLGSPGGEGIVYDTTINGMVCKIFHDNKLVKFRIQKLISMIRHQVNINGVCWPNALLYNSKLEIVGYLMPKANGYTVKEGLILPSRNRIFPNYKRKELILVSISILKMVRQLHERNVIIGDINDCNILVKDYNEIYIIDCDSFQIDGYPCPVSQEAFIRKHLQNKDLSKILRTKEDDIFAISTLIFMILFLGQKPYTIRNGGSTAENIAKGIFPYSSKNRNLNLIPMGCYEDIWNKFPRKLKDVFDSCFSYGNILPIDELINALENYIKNIELGKISNELKNM